MEVFEQYTKKEFSDIEKDIIEKLKKGELVSIEGLSKNFLESNELEEASFEGIKERLKEGKIDDAIKIKENFPISQEKLDSKELEEASFEGIKANIKKSWIDGAIKIKDNFPISQEKLEEASFEGIKANLKRRWIDDAIKIKETFPISQEKLKNILTRKVGILTNILEVSKEDFVEVFGEIIPEEKINPNLKYLENIHNYIVQKEEFDNSQNPETAEEEFQNLSGEEKAKKIFTNLSKLTNSVWDPEGERSDIANEFLLGAEKFGYKKMFDFIRQDNRHDALFAFDKIIKLQEKSGLETDDFYGKILFQVAKDSSLDINERDSYARLNDIAQKFAEKDIDFLVDEIKELNIASANKLLETIKNENGGYNFFQNWKIIQKIADFETILSKREILERIKYLPENQQEFYEKLIFHPNINTEAVIQMLYNPEIFLERDDIHSNENLHDLSKASNYYQFIYSNIDASYIIDSLVNGGLDRIQKIPQFQMEFKIAKRYDLRNLSIRELLRKAMGIRGEGRKLKDQRKFFKRLKI